jgi:transcription initiation factor IIE alpha subunit
MRRIGQRWMVEVSSVDGALVFTEYYWRRRSAEARAEALTREALAWVDRLGIPEDVRKGVGLPDRLYYVKVARATDESVVCPRCGEPYEEHDLRCNDE